MSFLNSLVLIQQNVKLPLQIKPIHSRYGVKYIEMYLNTNTLEWFKYKYYEMQKYLNTNTLGSILKTCQKNVLLIQLPPMAREDDSG